jgi:hypothetical protein
MSKMSRLLVLKKHDLTVEELKKTAREISRAAFKRDLGGFNHAYLEPYLDALSDTYNEFIHEWRRKETSSDVVQNFYGLRDFYNLMRTIADLIKSKGDLS